MIGYWHHNVVRLSGCLSICNAVHCGAQDWFTVVFLEGNFLLTSSDTFAVWCISFNYKTHRKKRTAEITSRCLLWLSEWKNASGTLRREWHSVRTESTSSVYKRCKQLVVVRSAYLATAMLLLYSKSKSFTHKPEKRSESRFPDCKWFL